MSKAVSSSVQLNILFSDFAMNEIECNKLCEFGDVLLVFFFLRPQQGAMSNVFYKNLPIRILQNMNKNINLIDT